MVHLMLSFQDLHMPRNTLLLSVQAMILNIKKEMEHLNGGNEKSAVDTLRETMELCHESAFRAVTCNEQALGLEKFQNMLIPKIVFPCDIYIKSQALSNQDIFGLVPEENILSSANEDIARAESDLIAEKTSRQVNEYNKAPTRNHVIEKGKQGQ